MLFIGDRNFKDTNRLKVKGKKKIYHESINCKRAVAVILISDKTDFFFLFLFWAPYRIWSSWARDQIGATVVDLCRRCSNTRSLLTHCARPGIQPTPPQQLEPLQRQFRYLIHSITARTPSSSFLNTNKWSLLGTKD